MTKAQGILGLATRAGQLVSGDFAVEKLLRAGEAGLVVVDASASDNTRKKFQDACNFRSVPLCIIDEEVLAQAIGRPGRKVAGIRAGALATRLQQVLLPQDKND